MSELLHEKPIDLATRLSNFAVIDKRSFFLLATLFVAFTARIWAPWYGLPIVYTGDEGQFIPPAVRFGTGDLNPHNFLYPSLYKYLLFFAYGVYFVIGKIFGIFGSVADFKLSYFTDHSDFYAIGRILSAMFGCMTVWIVYLIGRTIKNHYTGLVAALLLTVDYLHLRFSHLAKPDVTMTFLFMLAIYFVCRIYRKGELIDYLACGAFAGLAISTKYNAVFVILAIPLAHLLRDSESTFLEKLTGRIGYLLLAGLFVVLFFFIGTPYALLDFSTFLKDVSFQDFAISSEQTVMGFLATALAYFRSLFIPSVWSLDANYLGLFALLGILWTLYKADKLEIILLVLFGVQLFYVVFKTSESFVKPHFVMPLLPIAYLLGAKAIVRIGHKLTSVSNRFVVMFSAAVLLIAPVKHMVVFGYERSQQDTGNLARQWVEANLPDGSSLLYAGTQSLALVESEESILQNSHRKAKTADSAKLKAMAGYDGPKYHIQNLHHGWSYIPLEKLEQVEHVPHGLELLKAERLSLRYWREMGIEFVVVTGTKSGIEHYLRRQTGPINDFFGEVFSEATLIKEFVPNPPRRPGIDIRIYKL